MTWWILGLMAFASALIGMLVGHCITTFIIRKCRDDD